MQQLLLMMMNKFIQGIDCISYSRSLQHWWYFCCFYYFIICIMSEYYLYAALSWMFPRLCTFCLWNPTQPLLLINMSLFLMTAGVWTADFLGLYMLANTITISLSVFLHHLIPYLHFWMGLYSMPTFYKGCMQTGNWILVD